MDLISTYANGVSELTNFSQSLQKAPLIVDVIVNPHAGFFKRRSTLWKIILELEEKLNDLRKRMPRRSVEINTLHFTERPGHAKEIAETILEKEERQSSGIEHLLIACGGDGTSNEICTTLVKAAVQLRERVKLLRLPLGTGNDVADAPTFGEAYDLILGDQHTFKTAAIAVTGGSWREARYSFNVGSLGLDAYIANLTNRYKRAIPGQAYKALVDIGSMFYEQRVKPQPMNIRISGSGADVKIEGLVPSMVILGISGGRTYGGHMPVLPGEENVCVVDSMSLMRKITNKKLFYQGRHGELPEVHFYRGHRLDIDYKGSIPMQLDGEYTWLTPGDFPLTMRVLEPSIKVLRR